MAEVTVLGNGVVVIGHLENHWQKMIRINEQENKQRLQDYINGKYGSKKDRP